MQEGWEASRIEQSNQTVHYKVNQNEMDCVKIEKFTYHISWNR